MRLPIAPDNHGELAFWQGRQNDFHVEDFDCLLAEHRIPRRCKISSGSEPEEDF